VPELKPDPTSEVSTVPVNSTVPVSNTAPVSKPVQLGTEEDLRLQALARYAIVDTLPEAVFERLARLASRLLSSPIASISFFDERRQWVKAGCGLGVSEIARGDSLCNLVFEGGETVCLPDASRDSRFRLHPQVQGGLGVRFYASVPLQTPDGYAIGSLCVASPVPRTGLSLDEQADLADIAALVMDELELRLHSLNMEREAQARRLYAAELHEALSLAQTLQGVSDLTELNLGPGELLLRATELTGQALRVSWAGLAAVEGERATVVSAWTEPGAEAFARQAARGMHRSEGGLLWRAATQPQPVFVDDYAAQPGGHPQMKAAGAKAVLSAALGQLDGRTYVMTLARLEAAEVDQGAILAWSHHDQQLVRAVVQAMRQAMLRHTIQAALQDTQEQLRLTLGVGPLVLWATDMAGVFTLSEGRGLEDLGLKPGEAVGRHVAALYSGAPEVTLNVNRALAGESFSTTLTFGGRTFDTCYSPLLSPEGRQIGTLGVGYDVTAHASAEREERRARTQAEALVELSRVLDPALDLHQVADAALAALEHALKDVWLTLWQRDGDIFRSFAHRGQGSPQMIKRLQEGVPASRFEESGVLSGQNVFLTRAQMSESAVQDGVQGAALLPILTDQPEQEIVLVVSRTSEFSDWSAFERDLLGAASRTLAAGARRRRQHQRLEDAARTDLLTGLGNRRAFETDLATTLSRAQRDGSEVGVLSIDLDGLKLINDRQGHPQGDQLIRAFAAVLESGFRGGDQAYRLGGDEFVMVLPGAAHDDRAQIMSRVEQAVRQVRTAGFEQIGASSGLACFPADAQEAAELLRLSDAQMYAQKSEKKHFRAVQTALKTPSTQPDPVQSPPAVAQVSSPRPAVRRKAARRTP
jgi:diguanylate cyclase (GGDEF)-like protein